RPGWRAGRRARDARGRPLERSFPLPFSWGAARSSPGISLLKGRAFALHLGHAGAGQQGEKLMVGQALRMAVAGGLLISSVLAAEPLKDLQDKLASARSGQPIRVKVDVALEHQGKAPLHLNDVKEHGRVIVAAGPGGVEIREQKRIGNSTYLSLWRSP